MSDPALSVDTIAMHLRWFHERVERRAAGIEARAWSIRPRPSANLPDPAREFWEIVRLAEGKLEKPFGEDVVRACARAVKVLGRYWLDAARRGDWPMIVAYLEEGFPIDYADPGSGETALHAAAASRARTVVRVLLPLWHDFLAEDRRHRLPSDLAYEFGEDPALARLLSMLERRYAIKTGRDLAPHLKSASR
jgi:hypothetical protein